MSDASDTSDTGETTPQPRRAAPWLALVALAVAFAAFPAAADWLVTRDQGKVETRGAWEVQGRLVVFQTADGTLSSMRLDQVDLEASRQATQSAAAPQPVPVTAAPPAPPPPRRRITTEDVGRGTPRPPTPAAAASDGPDAEAASNGAAATPSAASDLVVLSSQEEETVDGHIRISGSLANQGEYTTAGISLTVYLQAADGEPSGSTQARLASRALTPGEVVSFQADFPDTFAYESLAFRASGTRLVTRDSADAPSAEGSDDDTGYAPPPEEDSEDGPDALYEPLGGFEGDNGD